MTHRLTFAVRDGVIEATLDGDLAAGVDAIQAALLAAAYAAPAARGILIDCRGLAGRPTATAAILRMRALPTDAPRLPVAVVDAPDHAAVRGLQAGAAAEVGVPFRWFADPDAARAWLTGR